MTSRSAANPGASWPACRRARRFRARRRQLDDVTAVDAEVLVELESSGVIVEA
ncbi:MAG: hypothetical protein QOD39_2155 [Mycobacterium sp.]|nr:hypothetical protein [Mycobacterium sp.]